MGSCGEKVRHPGEAGMEAKRRENKDKGGPPVYHFPPGVVNVIDMSHCIRLGCATRWCEIDRYIDMIFKNWVNETIHRR